LKLPVRQDKLKERYSLWNLHTLSSNKTSHLFTVMTADKRELALVPNVLYSLYHEFV